MKAKRRRIRFHFWLDINKQDEAEIADRIADLKLDRAFTAALRDGIVIISELRKGKVDKLLELYPWIRDAIGKPEGENSGGGGDRIARLEGQIQQLERLLITSNSSTPGMVARTSEPTKEPEFTIQKDNSDKAAKNLLGAMSGLM